MSGIISAKQFYRVFPDLDPELTGSKHSSTMQAFYTAIYEIGCLFGAIFALVWGNKIGRRRNIMIGTSLMLGSSRMIYCPRRWLLGLHRCYHSNHCHAWVRSLLVFSRNGVFISFNQS